MKIFHENLEKNENDDNKEYLSFINAFVFIH